jgi:uncharacterized membrane protein YhaH (DUF805 family)
MNDYLNVIRNNYANFTGRARRREYWMFSLINAVVVLVLAGLMAVGGLNIFMPVDPYNPPNVSVIGWLFFAVYTIYALGVFVPSLAVAVRRLHDTGKSGWMYLLILIPFVGSIVLLVFFATGSKPETNKWGPNPKGTTAPARAF